MSILDELQGAGIPRPGGFRKFLYAFAGLVAFYVALNIFATLYVDWIWFENLGFLSVFTTIIQVKAILFTLGVIVFAIFSAINIFIANKFSPKGVSPEAALNLSLETMDQIRRALLIATLLGVAIFSVIFGSTALGAWETTLRFTNSNLFSVADPLFNKDVSFYIFNLPLYRFLHSWIIGMVVVNSLIVSGIYAANFAIGGFQLRLTGPIRSHLSGLAAIFLLVLSFGYWLNLQELVFSSSAAAYGAGYADVNIKVPAFQLLTAVSLGGSLLMIANVYLRRALLPVVAGSVWVVVLVLGTFAIPSAVQRFQVDPNEYALERPYIERSIQMTRNGFAIDSSRVSEQPFVTQEGAKLDEKLIEDNKATIENIRLWDDRPLRDVYNQIQFFRLQYSFLDIDIDRYMINDDYRQVMVGSRELVQEQLPETAQTWVNRKLQYTHGYGIAMSPVTEFTTDGLPVFIIKDIPPESANGAPTVDNPQIYFGEATNDWVIVGSKTPEFDHPARDGAVYKSYSGPGIFLDTLLRKLIFAIKFGDLNLLITSEVTPESQILYYRNIAERVNRVAPFLYLDSDPYIVSSDDGQLYWIQDAYTISDRYPYSEPDAMDAKEINYIRNSAKIAVNAYDGSMTFYVTDPDDAIINTYVDVFPSLFKGMNEMPQNLKDHIRYPENFFAIQANKYLKFHMTDPQIFYNQEDLWEFPREIFFGESAQTMEPYYLIMKLPDQEKEEFVLIMPFTPLNKPNLVGWLAARNDGENYGKLVAFTFANERQIDGPQQVDARIDVNPEISESFTLWSQSGSKVLRGNLLVIPVGDNILYAEPVYLQAEDIEYPQLTRVVLVQQGQEPVMEPSLNKSLSEILGKTVELEVEKPKRTDDGQSLSAIKGQIERARVSLSDLQKQFSDLLDTLGEIANSGTVKSNNNE